jgi:hypothetical protein
MDASNVIPMLLNVFDVPIEYVIYAVIAWVVVSLAALDVTMVQFLAVMRLREMRKAGLIGPEVNKLQWWYYLFLVARGVLCDHWCQIFVCTPIGLELPPLKWHWYQTKVSWIKLPYYTFEMLVTDRLIRWNNEPEKNWWDRHVKKELVGVGKIMLDSADTDGVHITGGKK